MPTETESTVTVLANTGIGWVNRRDAADQLGKDALDAIQALKKHSEEQDRDVKLAVAKALKEIALVFQGTVIPKVPDEPPTLEKRVLALEKAAKRMVTKTPNGYEVKVVLNNFRTQIIHIEEGKSQIGKEVVKVYTTCGEAKEDVYRWCLKSNLQFTQCALAIEKVDGKDMLVLVNSFISDELTYNELKGTVKEVAYYGDWVEDKLTGGDVY